MFPAGGIGSHSHCRSGFFLSFPLHVLISFGWENAHLCFSPFLVFMWSILWIREMEANIVLSSLAYDSGGGGFLCFASPAYDSGRRWLTQHRYRRLWSWVLFFVDLWICVSIVIRPLDLKLCWMLVCRRWRIDCRRFNLWWLRRSGAGFRWLWMRSRDSFDDTLHWK